MKLDAVALGQRLKVRVVGHDDGHLDQQLARLHAEQQVVEAVANLGHHDEDASLALERAEVVRHGVLGGEGLEVGLEVGGGLGILDRGRRGKVHAHEEVVGGRVGELLQVQHVVALGGEDAGDGVDDAGLVGAAEREDVAGGGRHGGDVGDVVAVEAGVVEKREGVYVRGKRKKRSEAISKIR